MKSLKKYLAEFIGTFVLVLVACGVAVKSTCATSADVLLTALAFGGVIVAMAYSIGNISGCHINPAVSVAVLLNGGMSFKDFIGYVIAQFAGATAGAAVLGVFLGDFTNLGANGVANVNNSVWLALLVEAVLTCIFVLAVLGATSKVENGRVAGLVIGGALALVHMLGIYLTGTSVNPARSFGPALLQAFAGDPKAIACWWIFLVGPMAGGVLAALLWKLLNCKKKAA